ncbi:MAG TPA: hypothetical protein VJ323_00645, partial [Bryobacteraceae bacterium]|nr:hypothetical protein [Bryobacteraceae bacterium]
LQLRQLRGRRDMAQSCLWQHSEHGRGASLLALTRSQQAAEFLFEPRHELGAAYGSSGKRSAL